MVSNDESMRESLDVKPKNVEPILEDFDNKATQFSRTFFFCDMNL